MRIELPFEELAADILAAYAEEGVRGKELCKDGKCWVELSDEDLEKRTQLLEAQKSEAHLLMSNVVSVSNGANTQGVHMTPPTRKQKRLNMFIMDLSCNTSRYYKVTAMLKRLVGRQDRLSYITVKCESCGKLTGVLFKWDDCMETENVD